MKKIHFASGDPVYDLIAYGQGIGVHTTLSSWVSVRTSDFFAAKAKWFGFNIIKMSFRLRCKAKIIAILSLYLTLP